MQRPKNNRYQQTFSEEASEGFVFKMQPLNLQQAATIGQEQVLSVSSSLQGLPPLMGRAHEYPNHVKLQRQLSIDRKVMASQAPVQLSNNSKSGQPSSDSSFARTFKLLIEESSELR